MEKNLDVWKQCCDFVHAEMAGFVEKFVTPLTKGYEPGFGQALGTGSYITLLDGTFLITNNHVIREGRDGHIAHQPTGSGGEYVALDNSQIYTNSWPIDVALARVASNDEHGPRASIPAALFDERYQAIDGEMLFFIGYPGSTSLYDELVSDSSLRKSYFGEIEMQGLPMITQAHRSEAVMVPQFDQKFHVLIEYPGVAPRPGTMEVSPLFNPKGMSGSLLWDTRFIANGGNCNECPQTWRECAV